MVKLFSGDCIVEMRKIHSNTVDLILTDPPMEPLLVLGILSQI